MDDLKLNHMVFLCLMFLSEQKLFFNLVVLEDLLLLSFEADDVIFIALLQLLLIITWVQLTGGAVVVQELLDVLQESFFLDLDVCLTVVLLELTEGILDVRFDLVEVVGTLNSIVVTVQLVLLHVLLLYPMHEVLGVDLSQNDLVC